MAYDLEEQEQLATLKAWWARWGNLITWAAIAVLAAYAGWNGWNYYQRTQAVQAAQLYHELQRAQEAGDPERVQRAAADMTARYARTAYAPMAALAAAHSAYQNNDAAAAKNHLQWVIDNGAGEQHQALARLRLAGLLLDEKAYDAALKVLDARMPEQFAGLVEDRRGDILAAQNRTADARAAYQAALDKTDASAPGRELIRLKLDAIGGPAEKAAA
ncbi:MAG TPA: tetratricopeptide repeat protein [Noviherbaspirillum sp.]|nr:tetratricopeptide repeat protein [Noviherbaspirillum sp.]